MCSGEESRLVPTSYFQANADLKIVLSIRSVVAACWREH